MSIIIEPDEEQKRAQILRFRITSTLLAEISHRNAIELVDNLQDPKLSPKYRETIKVCDALAHALVMEHGVVSVTATHRYELNEETDTLFIAAVSEDTVNCDTTEDDTTTPSLASRIIRFLCSFNPPTAVEKPHQVVLPIHMSAQAPAGLTKENVLEYMQSLESNW